MNKKTVTIIGIVSLVVTLALVFGVVKLAKQAKAGNRAAQYLDALIYVKAMPSIEEVKKAVAKVEADSVASAGAEVAPK